MTHDIDHDLRALDPTSRQTNGLSDRALDDLHHIMATPSADPTSREYAGGRASGGPHRSRWVTRALPVAAAAAGLAVLAPSLLTDDSAFATWTAQPAAPAADDVEEAGRVCAENWTGDAGDNPVLDLKLVLAEQRGDWTYTVMTSSDDQYVECMMRLDRGPLGNLPGRSYAGGMGGLIPLAPQPPELDQIEAASYGATSVGDSDEFAFAVGGRAGDDVVSVVAHTPTAGAVQATVQGGFWAAWWPGEPGSGSVLASDRLSFTVTLADGSTSEVTYEDVEASLL